MDFVRSERSFFNPIFCALLVLLVCEGCAMILDLGDREGSRGDGGDPGEHLDGGHDGDDDPDGDSVDADTDGGIDADESAPCEEMIGPVEEAHRVTNDPGESKYPTIVWTGTEYGIVWLDDRDGNFEIFFARLDREGELLSDILQITNTAGTPAWPSLQWTGSNYGLCWHESLDENADVFFARFSASGELLGGIVPLKSEAGDEYRPSIAWAGEMFGMLWVQEEEIYFNLLSSEGEFTSEDEQISFTPHDASESPLLTWTGSEFGGVWVDWDGGARQVHFQRISAEGVPLGRTIMVSEASEPSQFPTVAWTGNEYGVAWSDWYAVYFARVSPEGERIGSVHRITEQWEEVYSPEFAWTPGGYGLAWTEVNDSLSSFWFAGLTETGEIDVRDVLIARDEILGVAIPTISMATSDSHFAFAWHGPADGNNEIYFTRLPRCEETN